MSQSRLVVPGIAIVASLVLGCSTFLGQLTPVAGYRIDDGGGVSVLATGSEGFEIWVDSVQETDTRVTVAVRTKPSNPMGGGAPLGVDVWLPIRLQAPLGDREVFDAVTGKQVAPILRSSASIALREQRRRQLEAGDDLYSVSRSLGHSKHHDDG